MSLFEKILSKERVIFNAENSPPKCAGQQCDNMGGLILELPQGALILCREHAKLVYAELRNAGIDIPVEWWEKE